MGTGERSGGRAFRKKPFPQTPIQNRFFFSLQAYLWIAAFFVSGSIQNRFSAAHKKQNPDAPETHRGSDSSSRALRGKIHQIRSRIISVIFAAQSGFM